MNDEPITPMPMRAGAASQKPLHLLVTCEHGGRRVPPRYRSLFFGHEALLDTHRGSDFGALALAREMADAFAAPLYASTTTRLLIDLNRSIGHPSLHSEATRHLSAAERRTIVETYYRPHRDKVEADVRQAIERGECALHIASHSFTPELNGEVRNADVGLLYNPARAGEKQFARRWMEALRDIEPGLRVRLNYPYAGKGDGLTALLRKRWAPQEYIGIELEVNQRYVQHGGPAWPSLRATVIQALRASLPSRGG
jgi:predicted N-formylglutamate amidohydrolase